MSLWRGIQSAIFHYLSCAPCTGYAYQKKRRKQARRDMKEQKQMRLENPDLYEHPGPNMTNPYWEAEIRLGPGPPPRKARGKANSRRGLTTAGTWSTVNSHGSSATNITGGTARLSSQRASEDTLTVEGWTSRRYQQDDDGAWDLDDVHSITEQRRQSSVTGSSIGMPGLSRPETAASTTESYYMPRATPVNDLHPPIVSIPKQSKADNAWMLAPPPKARTRGGQPRTASRNGSSAGRSNRSEQSVQRQVSARKAEEKKPNGIHPIEAPNNSFGARRPSSRKPKPLDIPPDPHSTTNSSTENISKNTNNNNNSTTCWNDLPSDMVKPHPSRKPSRPVLSTIESQDTLDPRSSTLSRAPSADGKRPALQHSASAQSRLNSRLNRAAAAAAEEVELQPHVHRKSPTPPAIIHEEYHFAPERLSVDV